MKRFVAPLVLGLLAAHEASAQTSPVPPVQWNAAPAAAQAQLLQGGFARSGSDTAAVYTRKAGSVQEQLYIRTRGGQHWNVTYSAMGDSASLQAKLDGVSADQAQRSGPGMAEGAMRMWSIQGGERLAVPTHPSRLPDGATFQFMIVYHRP